MNNRIIIIRTRNALALSHEDMLEIYKLGGIELNDVMSELIDSDGDSLSTKHLKCDNETLENYLNGLILFKRGRQEPKPGQPEKQPFLIKSAKDVNNVVLKKLKVALSLTSEDMIELYNSVGVRMTKGDLTPLFRKQGHKHYKLCTDFHLTKFIEAVLKAGLSED